ncbi:spore germination protein GerPB [Pseudoneobacillus sp. C159]
MNFYIQQSINIHLIKIGGISNSSVFQIGSTGIIKPAANLFNTGGFIKPAPEVQKPGGGFKIPLSEIGGKGPFPTAPSSQEAPLVPFSIS